MKNKFLFLLPCVLLTSCGLISFSNLPYDEGFNDGKHHGGNPAVFESEENRITDQQFAALTEGLTSHTFSFNENTQNSQPELKTEQEVRSIMVDEDSVVSEISNIKNVNQFHGLKIGNLNPAVNGTIKFGLSVYCSYVAVMIKPRSTIVYSEELEEHVIDKDLGLSVNGSKYLRINTDFSTIDSIKETPCYFRFKNESGDDTSVTSLDLSVVYQRAEITSIIIYE